MPKRKGAFVYSADQWQAVTQAIPSDDPKLLQAVRRELQQNIITPYLEAMATEEEKSTQTPLDAMRKALAAVDHLPPDTVADFRQHARDIIEAMEDANRRNRGKGRSKRLRGMLYEAILRIWTGMLGQKLARNKPDKGASRTTAPSGPTLRFLQAVLRPVMKNEMPGPWGVVDIIEREHDARTDTVKQVKAFKATQAKLR
ncbi:hypothetical protein [Bradyrhizobium valentinum]|uniref:Uncharacterized protein n=1 Tax=Bradyrhizobium valentinum TaxID=1518501 RepID=A0A0R3LU93_9BRAD|nr:hypothetical protein [Bradyrhizobium valentinum]KRR11546.1 hypothetical protein CP49_18090 [Bradyrhizobium valentinum]